MLRRVAILAAALLALPLTYAAARPGVPSKAEPAIACFGDSITAGYGLPHDEAWPADLQRGLDARGYHYRVINAGISGNTTKDGLDRLKDLLALHPALVVVELGGNDGLRGIPITDTRRNLDTIVAMLRRDHIQVFLAGITLPPNYGPDYIHQFDETYRLAAAKYHVPLLPMIYTNIYTVPGAIQPDGIHPTAKGSRLIADKILPLLLPMLHK